MNNEKNLFSNSGDIFLYLSLFKPYKNHRRLRYDENVAKMIVVFIYAFIFHPLYSRAYNVVIISTISPR